MEEINSSINIDKRLALVDIMGSRAHVRMLADRKIVKEATKQKILSEEAAKVESAKRKEQTKIREQQKKINKRRKKQKESLTRL